MIRARGLFLGIQRNKQYNYDHTIAQSVEIIVRFHCTGIRCEIAALGAKQRPRLWGIGRGGIGWLIDLGQPGWGGILKLVPRGRRQPKTLLMALVAIAFTIGFEWWPG